MDMMTYFLLVIAVIWGASVISKDKVEIEVRREVKRRLLTVQKGLSDDEKSELDYSRQRVPLLERRLKRLVSHLRDLEVKLEELAAQQNVDSGIASIYHEVQGLNRSDRLFEQKKAALANIFEDNLKLQS